MQPDNQNQQPLAPQPTQNGYISPSGADVPEYLHMDPIVEKPKKSKKKLFISVGVILALLLIGGGGYGYWWWMKTEPERKFYSALDKAMAVQYLEQDIHGVATDQSRELSITAKSDFSDLKKFKSQFQYSLIMEDQYVGNKLEKVEFNGKEILTSQGDMIVQFLRFPSIGQYKNRIIANQWYAIPPTDIEDIKYYDVLNLRTTTNFPFMLTIFGNINAANRAKIINYMKANSIYTIHHTDHDMIDNHQATVYTVSATNESIDKLDSYVASLFSLSNNSPQNGLLKLGKLTEVTLWVDDTSGMFTKAAYKFNDSTDNKNASVTATININYTYPSSLKIEAPTETRSLPEV